jgi:hypothetical protein
MRPSFPALCIMMLAVIITTGCLHPAVQPDIRIPANATVVPSPGIVQPSPSSLITVPVPAPSSVPVTPRVTLKRPARVQPVETVKPSPTPVLGKFEYAPMPDPYLPVVNSIVGEGEETDTPDSGGQVANCIMVNAFQGWIGDPAYDLNHPQTAALFGVTPGEYEYFMRLYDEDAGLVDTCFDQPVAPLWEVMEVNAEFTTMNSRPVTFETTLYAQANGAKIPVLTTTDTLNPDQKYKFSAYFPVKKDQVQEISSLNIAFVQVS